MEGNVKPELTTMTVEFPEEYRDAAQFRFVATTIYIRAHQERLADIQTAITEAVGKIVRTQPFGSTTLIGNETNVSLKFRSVPEDSMEVTT